MICIPLSFYYGFANEFLVETDRPAPTALQTLGQISEVFFMAAMPFFIVRLGVKNMLLVGMLAWVARYLCFSTLDFSLVLVGLVLHGVCYDFFFVASQIYVDKKAPRHLRASAQSLIAFITLGLGMFVGSNVSGWIVKQYPAVAVTVTTSSGKEVAGASLPHWADTQSGDTLWRVPGFVVNGARAAVQRKAGCVVAWAGLCRRERRQRRRHVAVDRDSRLVGRTT